jgi:hypothetical protein
VNGQVLTLLQAGGRTWHDAASIALGAPPSGSCAARMTLGGATTATQLDGQSLEYRVEQGAVALSATYVDLQNDRHLQELPVVTAAPGTRQFRFVTASGRAYQVARPTSLSSVPPVVTVTGVMNGTRQPAEVSMSGANLYVLPTGPTQQLEITVQSLSYDIAASTCVGGVPCEALPVFAADASFTP